MGAWASTGFDGLDELLSLQKGDNVVWQVDSVDDFRCFVKPYVTRALRENRKVVYLRFAGGVSPNRLNTRPSCCTTWA
jgi:hypothetical protein